MYPSFFFLRYLEQFYLFERDFEEDQEDDSMDGFWNCIAILKILIKLLCFENINKQCNG